MPEDIKTLRQYSEYLKTERAFWDNGIWQDLVDNLLPEWEDLSRIKQKGKRKASRIYDSSPRDYLNTFADGMHGNMIPPGLVWFEQRLPSFFSFLEEEPAVREWLQNVSEQLFFVYANTNFYSQMRKFFRAGGGLGTANVYLEEDKSEGKPIFHNLHPRESYFSEDQYGNIDTCFRFFTPTARVFKQMFGEDKLSPQIKASLKTNPFNEYGLWHAVYPNDEFDSSKISNRFKRFSSKWFEAKEDPRRGDQFLRESGHLTFPFHPWRYIRGENGPYGDSPGSLAIPEIMGLQQMGKTLLRAGHVSVDPALNVPAEMKGKVRTGNHGMNYYGPDYNRIIRPMTTGINYPIGDNERVRVDAILKRHYHVDFFQLLQSRERQMTAREVQELLGEKATILSAGVGDLTNVLDGIHDHTYEIESRAGRMPVPPDILIEHMGGMRIPIEYTGPLAMAQKRLFKTRGITDALAIAQPFIELFPETADLIMKDDTLKDLLKAHGFPQSNIAPTSLVEQIRDGRAETQQAESTKIDMERLSEVLKDLAMADKQSGGKFNQQIQQILGTSQPGAIPTAA